MITLRMTYFVLKDSPIGSMVFRVIAVDADDPFTPEGQIQFSILRDGSDADAFHIGKFLFDLF